MRQPCIGMVVPSLAHGGGVPAVAEFIARAIEKSGAFDLRVISVATAANDASSARLAAPHSWRAGAKTSPGEWRGRPFTHVGAWWSEFEFQRYRGRRALHDLLNDCDLVQVVSGSPAFGFAVTGLDKPLVLQVATRAIVERRRRAMIERGAIGAWRKLITKVTDCMERRALQRADAVMVENLWMKEYVETVTRRNDTLIRFAPPGVDSSTFIPWSGRLGENGGRGYILFVGRLDDPRKNVGLLLEAYAQLCARFNPAPALAVAGGADPGKLFWQHVKDLGLDDAVRFHLSPTQAELIALYQGATCFALPSDEEGFGVVLIEAMSCGVPVIATRCGGPEGIVTDGVDGFLVPRNDADAMANQMAELVASQALNLQMGAAARLTVEQRFSEAVTGAAFLETYEELLRRSRQG